MIIMRMFPVFDVFQVTDCFPPVAVFILILCDPAAAAVVYCLRMFRSRARSACGKCDSSQKMSNC